MAGGYFNRVAGQQTAAAYKPQYSNLAYLMRQAAGTLHNERAYNQQDAEAIAQAAHNARAVVGGAYGGGMRAEQADSRLFGHPGGSAGVQQQLESNALRGVLQGGLAQALTQLSSEARGAQAGRVYADNAAVGQYNTDRGKIGQARLELGQKQAADTLSLAGQLAAAHTAALQQQAQMQAQLRQQHIDNIFKKESQALGRANLAQKQATAGAALHPLQVQAGIGDVQAALALIKQFAPQSGRGLIAQALRTGQPLERYITATQTSHDPKTGKVTYTPYQKKVGSQKVPKLNPLYVQAALDLYNHGGLNPGTATQLPPQIAAALGIAPKGAGLQVGRAIGSLRRPARALRF